MLPGRAQLDSADQEKIIRFRAIIVATLAGALILPAASLAAVEARPAMTLQDAQRVFAESMTKKPRGSDAPGLLRYGEGAQFVPYLVTAVVFTPDTIVMTAKQRFAFSQGKEETHVVQLRELKNVHEKVGGGYYIGLDQVAREAPGYGIIPYSGNEAFAQSLIDALAVIRNDVVQRDERQFAEIARGYREAAVKPALPEDARRFRVQAEAAIRDKDFGGAAELYANGLAIAPWWPEGHFNRALILAELKEFEPAIAEMKRYLELAPDAPDARANQDRIYEWEAKIPAKR